MKNAQFFKLSTLCVVLFLCSFSLDAQNVLRQSKLTAETIGTKQVYRVKAAQVKNGTNVVKLDSGEQVEFVVRKGKITAMKRIDRTGISVNIPMSNAVPIDGNGFTCNGLFCRCEGDSDCNDMFSSDVCGCCFGVCIDKPDGTSICICGR